MKAYIALSYHKRNSLDAVLNVISEILLVHNIIPFVFLDHYQYTIQKEVEMMKKAFEEINDCDLFIAETSDKAIGIGVEAGYAKAKNKPVIYLRQKDTAHSTTLSGISDHKILYEDIYDLKIQLKALLHEMGI